MGVTWLGISLFDCGGVFGSWLDWLDDLREGPLEAVRLCPLALRAVFRSFSVMLIMPGMGVSSEIIPSMSCLFF